MPLNNITYPVTIVDGVKFNTFPSQKTLYLTARRIDQTVSGFSSGVGGSLQINTAAPMVGVEVGDYVAFGALAYEAQSARVLVTNGTNPTQITVDADFISVDISNSFINYHKNYFLQVRYVREDSTDNDQNALEIIKDYTQTPNDLNGDISANIGLPAELLTPDFNIASEINDGLSVSYMIQYRESYEGARSLPWVSPSPNLKILLIHATELDEVGTFTDATITKRYIKGYPTLYSLVYSDINDPDGLNALSVTATQYDIQKKIISSSNVFTDVEVNGVITIYIDPATINEDCRFIDFSFIVTASNGQYDGADYEPDDYQTELESLGFPYTFPIVLS